MNQQQVWNRIAEPWQKFRQKTPEEVAEFLKYKKGKVLDLGCGSGRNFVKNSKIVYYGVDFSEKMLKLSEKYAKKERINVTLFKNGAENLPFKNNFFDFAIFISTLHCIEGETQRKKSLQELFRVLKDSGEAMISVWDKKSKPGLNKKNAKEGFVIWKKDNKKLERYYYFYSRNELEKELIDCGFKIINSKYSSKNEHSRKNIIFYVHKLKPPFASPLVFL